MRLFSELKRRNVLRVATAYVAVSWLLIQVVETLFPVFGMSDAAIRTVVIVLAIGFVPAVIVAWAFELTPDGLVRDSEVDRGSSAVKAATRRLDRIVMVALALAVGYFAFDKFMLDPGRDAAIAEAAREQGRSEAVQASQDSGPPVLAVLPFSAVTATEDSEFFAAGVHDDLLTRLAQLPSMLVISRTSVLEYQDTQQNIREIGAALGADAILEGGVQSAGNRIRINAQLIDARTDEHLWAETYDRELTAASIFDVQDDIARAIAQALHLTLAAPSRENLIPTSNMAAYRAYHEAISRQAATHGARTSDEYRELLQEAIDLDPNFTRPRALLVGSYALDSMNSDDPQPIARAEAILEDIRAIAPNSADHLVAQTYYTYYVLKDYDLALQILDRALELVPSDSQLVAIRSWIQRRQGDTEGQLESLRLARRLEPGNEWWSATIINNLQLAHRYNDAQAEIDAFEGTHDGVEWLRAHLAFRDHGDLQRLAAELESLARESDSRHSALFITEARIMARDYAGAIEMLDSIDINETSLRWGLSARESLSIVTHWLAGDTGKVAALVADARSTLSALGTIDEMMDKHSILSVAMLAAAEGNTDEAVRLVRAWDRGYGQDRPIRINNWEIACQILGMAGAAEAAADCIRQGLEQPSKIMPFLDPFLPYYDGIRDEPAFVELVEELANWQEQPRQ
jgi:TolB-like protein